MRTAYPYIDEWIEYHRIMGVEKFFLHHCKSNSSTVYNSKHMSEYVKTGIVELFPWCPPELDDWDRSLQTALYADCLYRYMDHVEWLAVIDPDEYLCPLHFSTLLPLFNKYEANATSGLRFQNVFFGPCPEEHVEKSKLVIERFTTRSQPIGISDRTKVILRTSYAYHAIVHSVTHGFPMVELDPATEGRMNHYYCASRNRTIPDHPVTISDSEFSDKFAEIIKEQLR